MKTLRNIVLVMLAIVAACIVAAPAQAQSDPLVNQLLADYGWHGVGGDVQVNKPTMEVRLPWIGVWERSPKGERYGDWMYIQVMIDCTQWKQIPFATLDADFNYVRMETLTGQFPTATWPEPGTEPYRTMTQVCGLFGYTRPAQLKPSSPGNLDGTPYVGTITKLADRQPARAPRSWGNP